MRHLFFSSILLFALSGCGENLPEESGEPAPSAAPVKPLSPRQLALAEACGVEDVLNDPSVPGIAKQLFLSTYQFGTDEPLVLFRRLQEKDPLRRMFYFKAITRISDGYYSQQLAQRSADYVLHHTADFAALFDYRYCITETDLQTWVDNITLHLKATAPASGESAAEKFDEKLFAHCKGCPEAQKETIGRFAALLEANWAAYMAEQ